MKAIIVEIFSDVVMSFLICAQYVRIYTNFVNYPWFNVSGREEEEVEEEIEEGACGESVLITLQSFDDVKWRS